MTECERLRESKQRSASVFLGTGIVMMKWLKKLGNPFALVAQGFAVGAVIFLATGDSPARVEALVRGLVS